MLAKISSTTSSCSFTNLLLLSTGSVTVENVTKSTWNGQITVSGLTVDLLEIDLLLVVDVSRFGGHFERVVTSKMRQANVESGLL